MYEFYRMYRYRFRVTNNWLLKERNKKHHQSSLLYRELKKPEFRHLADVR